MKPGRGRWRLLTAALAVCATSVAMAGIAVPSAAATPAGTVKTVPVQELSSVVLKLIKTVEDSTAVACETRNDVVRRLRELDDALLSGRRSAAQVLATAWRQDAWSMEAARVIGPELGSSLQNRLSRLQGTIGSGDDKPGPTRHWKPLPSCDTTGVTSGPGVLASATNGAEVVGSYNPTIEDPMADLKILLKMGLGMLNLFVPGLGMFLSGVVDLVWPAGPNMANLLQDLVDGTTYGLVSYSVNELAGELEGSPGAWDPTLRAWQLTCQKPVAEGGYGGFDTDDCALAARNLFDNGWSNVYSDFLGVRTAIENAGDQVYTLPLFAAYENLLLPFLSQGVQLHEYWKANPSKGWLALDNTTLPDGSIVATPLAAMDQELDAGYRNPETGLSDRGIGYVNRTYNTGLNDVLGGWEARNTYIRDMTLKVLDFRDMWKYFDPRKYPDGVPGGVKLTRMIYSDPVGQAQAAPSLPRNVAGPLKEVSIWTKDVYSAGAADRAISSVQATSPLSLGPAQSGPIQGALDLPHNAAYYKNLGDATCSGSHQGQCAGPIISVIAGRDRRGILYDFAPSAIHFFYAAGGWSQVGRFSNYQTVSEAPRFSYDGEVLATVRVASHYHWSDSVGSVADAVVFGFRYADSYNPAGVAIGVGSGKCITVSSFNAGSPAALGSCSNPPTETQVWTYDPGLQQLSVTSGLQQFDASPGNGLKMCLGLSFNTGAPVIGFCDNGAVSSSGVSSQRWTIDAAGAGIAKITNVRTGKVLTAANNATADGTPLVLSTYSSGNTSQQWKASDPLTGEIHGIASGKCVAVPNEVTTPGTQVQIWDCTGGAGQQWTYNPTNKELIYSAHPSLCLEARGGGTTSGTAVQINACTGAAEQKWTLQGNGSYVSNDKSGLELSVPGGATGNGASLQLITANGTEAQQWSRTSNQGGALFAVGAGKCLDLPSWNNGTPVVIHGCYTPLSAAQTWTYHPIAQTFTVNSPSGPKCLDTAGGATTAGTAVVVNDCTGVASQRWTLDFARSTVTNVNSIQYTLDGDLASAMVLRVTGGGTSDGTTVQLTQSVGANGKLLIPASDQQWVWALS